MTRSVSPSLDRYPNLEDWVRLDAGGRVSVRTGKVELGQGLTISLARIAAEELDVSVDRIDVLTADTSRAPNEGTTAGSTSLVTSGAAIRQASAEARRRLLLAAAERLGAEPVELTVEDGVVRGPAGGTASYWELLGATRLDGPVGDEATPKPPEQHRLVGHRGPAAEPVALADGTARFVHDLELPGMLHGRVVRPPRPGARLHELDEQAAAALPGVIHVVRDGSFLAVTAEREEQAVGAREALRRSSRWTGGDTPPTGPVDEWLLAQPARTLRLSADGAADDDPVPPEPPDGAALTLRRTYTRGYVLHGSIGPSAAAACWSEDTLTVWCSSQGIYSLRDTLAEVLSLDPARVRVIHLPGSGCYGHNGADDVALDAALVAGATGGRPVLVKWMREDEHLFEPFGPAAVVETRASIDDDGRIVDWVTRCRSQAHSRRPKPSAPGTWPLAARYLDGPARPPAEPSSLLAQDGVHRNAVPPYEIPGAQVVMELVDAESPRTSALRSLGSFVNVFAVESAIDELADAAGLDPLGLRLSHLTDPRARAVLDAAAERIGLPGRAAGEESGIGIAYARYKRTQCHAAVAVEVTVDDATAAVRLERIVIAADAGQIIDPAGLIAQLEGGALQAASWTLLEQVEFDGDGPTSSDWDSYPILRFADVPLVETVLLDRPDCEPLGAGEATQGPTAAAIANAVHAAVGLRVRRLPITPERLRAAAAEPLTVDTGV